MYKSLMAIDAEEMEEQSVSTLFTKDSIQAFNQVSHDIFIVVNLQQLHYKHAGCNELFIDSKSIE